jgi:hypothetical protein
VRASRSPIRDDVAPCAKDAADAEASAAAWGSRRSSEVTAEPVKVKDFAAEVLGLPTGGRRPDPGARVDGTAGGVISVGYRQVPQRDADHPVQFRFVEESAPGRHLTGRGEEALRRVKFMASHATVRRGSRCR